MKSFDQLALVNLSRHRGIKLVARYLLLLLLVLSTGALRSQAETITFTGGTVHFQATNGVVSTTTAASELYNNVFYYVEQGYRFDYIDPNPSEQYVGNYYTSTNDVLHGHFSGTGLTEIRVSKIDGSLFDLDSLMITSNTQNGGGYATGFEDTHLLGSYNGVSIGADMMLPPDTWGGAMILVTPGASFTNLKYFSIISRNADCVGIDNVVVNDVSAAPLPSSLALLLTALPSGCGFFFLRRRRKNASSHAA